jgi:RNA-binding protein 39
LALSGTPFMGQIIQVQQTQAEKNRAAAVHALTTTTTFGPTRLYVGSLHFNITEEDLRMVFSPFGDIEFINLHMDPETGRSKGYAFVQFKRPDDAKKALQQVNGLEIAGRQIKVGLVNESSKELGLLSGDLDDDEGGGLSLNAQSRALLMQKLAKGQIPNTSTPTPVSPPKINNIPPPPPSPPSPPPPPPPSVNQVSPSPCIVLKNMFDPTIETEPNWDLEIAEDVTEECSKFGSIVHCYVDKKSQGFVYLKFGSIPGAQIAIKNLNGRWFSGRMISASFISENTYYKMFPEAIKK